MIVDFRRTTRELVRPLPMAATALLVLNDHVLKGAHLLPAWCTGKLSDFAGLFVFPIFLFALAAAFQSSEERRARRASLAALLTVVPFASIKLSPSCNLAINALGWGRFVLDPSDLLALPAAFASVSYLRRAPRIGAQRPSWLAHVGVLFAALASLATSRPQVGYPYWRVSEIGDQESPVRESGCVAIQAAVVRSGKQGLGVLLVDRSRCAVRLIAARVRVGAPLPDGSGKVQVVDAVPYPTWDGDRSVYLAFEFDNERTWNEGVRSGVLQLVVEAEGEPRATLSFEMVHGFNGAHTMSRLDPWPGVSVPPDPEPSSAPLQIATEPDGGAGP